MKSARGGHTKKKERHKRDDKKRGRSRKKISSPFFFSHSLIKPNGGLKLKSRNFLFFSFRVSGVEVYEIFSSYLFAYGLTQLRRRSPPQRTDTKTMTDKAPAKDEEKGDENKRSASGRFVRYVGNHMPNAFSEGKLVSNLVNTILPTHFN